MLASPRHKRPRSPSPSLESSDLTSPLDVFLKRRRRHDSDSYHDNSLPLPFTAGPPPSEPHMVDGEDSAESSLTPWHRFVEKRRTRQWERQNAPQPLPSQTLSQPHLAPSSNSYPDVPSSQPTSSSSSDPLSPAPGQRWHSQPEPRQHANAQMSSSPIRHHPPTSSPFRPGPSSEVTRVEEWMDPEEMRREWGEEYAAQNSLLHSLVSILRNTPYLSTFFQHHTLTTHSIWPADRFPLPPAPQTRRYFKPRHSLLHLHHILISVPHLIAPRISRLRLHSLPNRMPSSHRKTMVMAWVA